MSRPLPILFTFRRCPYAIRARMALTYAGVDYEKREIDLKERPKELYDLSPKGTVPVLKIPGGMVLEESLDIMHWALRQSDPEGWYRYDSLLCKEIDSLILENDTTFKKSLDIYKYPNRSSKENALEHREKGVSFLKKLNVRLASSPYFFGETCSLADVALFPFVRQFAGVDKEWFEQVECPKLHQWFQCFLKSPLFIKVMEKKP